MKLHGSVHALRLSEPEDFKNLSVVVDATHLWVSRAELIQLAGEIADTAWTAKLDEMINFAQMNGWVNGAGEVRAHIEGI